MIAWQEMDFSRRFFDLRILRALKFARHPGIQKLARNIKIFIRKFEC